MAVFRRKLIGVPVLALAIGGNAFAVTCAQMEPPPYANPVHVSPSGVDNETCGTVDSPCKTIQHGIDLCVARNNGCAVFVRYGLYLVTEPVRLTHRVNLYGSCVFDGSDARYRTIVVGSPAFAVDGIQSKTLLMGFVIVGSDASQAGQPSIAMTVNNSGSLTISRSILASGKGGDGSSPAAIDGTEGEAGRFPNGNSGGFGGRACAASPTAVGMGGQGADFQSVYSSGCFAACQCQNNNAGASSGKDGADSGRVRGGAGGPPSGQQGCACACGSPGDGPPGNPGGAGLCGASSGIANPNNKGLFSVPLSGRKKRFDDFVTERSLRSGFSEITWSPTQGGSGDSGQVGSGGGGGGSGGMATFFGNPDIPGLPGGGGGGGGCAGSGGRGGAQGGASIPLVVWQSRVNGLDLDDVVIPGPGGRGGHGAAGGRGGPGGFGGDAPQGHQTKIVIGAGLCTGYAPGSGGRGGDGGPGGGGSGGAGGNGGPSSGIALIDSSNVYSAVAIYPTQPGANGMGGGGGRNASCQGAKGADGITGASDVVITFP